MYTSSYMTVRYSRSTRMLPWQRFLPDKLILIASVYSLATKSPEVNWQP